MPTQLQFRRGTTAQNNSFTGVVGELTIDTNTDNIQYMMDLKLEVLRLFHLVRFFLLVDQVYQVTFFV